MPMSAQIICNLLDYWHVLLVMKHTIIIWITFLFISTVTKYGYAQSNDVWSDIKVQDSMLFEIGYNKCDLTQFESLLSNNFEFYHDQAGSILSKSGFIESVRNNVCNLSYKAERQLIDSSLYIYTLKKKDKVYGAVQSGLHQFYAIDSTNFRQLTSTAKFTNLWLLESGKWKLSRSLSYDHKDIDADEIVNERLLFIDKVETEKWLVQKHIPALGIGYIENGKITEVTVYGKNEKGVPYPANTIFNVASLTKPVTAMVALKLVNAGKWSLDEPLYHYWTDPDVAGDPRSKELNTSHVLSHQTGFPNWRNKLSDGKLAFSFPPGTAYGYSGEGFEYLRKALENKFKKSLDQLAQELIFDPLNMKDTRFTWAGDIHESRFANWYKKDGSQYKTYKNMSANAADDLLTTVEDYSKFLAYMIKGAGLNEDLYQKMISKQVSIKPRQYFGLSWIGYEHINGNEKVLQHGGDDIGVHTIAFMLPDSRKGLIIFTNCDNGIDVYIPIIQHYLGKLGQEIIDIEMATK